MHRFYELNGIERQSELSDEALDDFAEDNVYDEQDDTWDEDDEYEREYCD